MLSRKIGTVENKRYSVFISSTWEDLKQERRAVQDIIISSGDFPVQMESFPAADEDVFEFIKSFIRECDYYILIISGKHGSVADDGLSYTQKEYRYAVSEGVPVLAMLRGNPESIPSGMIEKTDERQKRLSEFITEVKKERHYKTWTTPEELKIAVREALDHAKRTRKRVGWVRGNSIASIQILEELNEVRKENYILKEQIGIDEILIDLPKLPKFEETFQLEIIPNQVHFAGKWFMGSAAIIEVSWSSIFPIFFQNLDWSSSEYGGRPYYMVDEEKSCIKIGSSIAQKTSAVSVQNAFKIDTDTYFQITNYYIEAGLMYANDSDQPFSQTAQKLARRYSINSDKSNYFKIIKGVIEVKGIDQISNDDIPF